ncbi:MAG: membrane protein insertase YidC, partial [Pseudomonadota bacterium]
TGTVQTWKLEENNIAFEINNYLEVVDTQNPIAKFSFRDTVGKKVPLQIQVISENNAKPVFFEFTDKKKNLLVAENQQFHIKAILKINEKGLLQLQLISPSPLKYRFLWQSEEKRLDTGMIREFVVLTKDAGRTAVGSTSTIDDNVKWLALDFNYHLFAFILNEKMALRGEMTKDGNMIVDTVNPTNVLDTKLIFVKKNYDDLVALGDNLNLGVDFGMFSVLAVPILRGLQFFYKFIPNYGVAIIFLTLIIRLLTFPLQYKSFKSMKKMQDLQPELTKLKEKFKDEPQKMQKETMELFKRSGANPLGGCLPLVLQMPIFFAFYRVLYCAVELVGAPFMAHIHDLSAKDHLYILPVLMGLAMLIQQKMTPSPTMDNTQRKIMMAMPVVFAFIMKDFPSGLNLYILISTLFGMGQQQMVYKLSK